MKEYQKPTAEIIELKPEERLAASSDFGGGKDNCAANPGVSTNSSCDNTDQSQSTPSLTNK